MTLNSVCVFSVYTNWINETLSFLVYFIFLFDFSLSYPNWFTWVVHITMVTWLTFEKHLAQMQQLLSNSSASPYFLKNGSVDLYSVLMTSKHSFRTNEHVVQVHAHYGVGYNRLYFHFESESELEYEMNPEGIAFVPVAPFKNTIT